jgi:hypothetical protein
MDFGGAGRSNVAHGPTAEPGTLSGTGGPGASVGEEETMTDPWAVLAGLAAVAFVFVVAPVAGSVYFRLRAPQWLRCPETRMPAAVAVDARRAAWTAVWSRPLLRIRSCTLWPRRAGCAQRCCELPEIAEGPAGPPGAPLR